MPCRRGAGPGPGLGLGLFLRKPGLIVTPMTGRKCGGVCGCWDFLQPRGFPLGPVSSLLSSPPPHLSWQVGLLPGPRQLPPPSQPPHEGWLLCRGKLCGMLLFLSITGGETLSILLEFFPLPKRATPLRNLKAWLGSTGIPSSLF